VRRSNNELGWLAVIAVGNTVVLKIRDGLAESRVRMLGLDALELSALDIDVVQHAGTPGDDNVVYQLQGRNADS
jgi:hypothetical protein